MTLILKHLRKTGDMTSPMRFGRFTKNDAENVVRVDLIVTGVNQFETQDAAVATVAEYAALAQPQWLLEPGRIWRVDLDALKLLADCEVEAPWPEWMRGQADGHAVMSPHSRWRVMADMRTEVAAEKKHKRQRDDLYFGPALVTQIFIGPPEPRLQTPQNNSLEFFMMKSRVSELEAQVRDLRAKTMGRLKIESRLGGGAHADVWRALDCLSRIVAAKIIRPSVAGYVDARSHATTLARLEHPNIVRVYTIETVIDPEIAQEAEAIVMEYLHGSELAQRLRGPRFSKDLASKLGAQILAGVGHMHANGLAHGDLHAGNLIVDSDQIKIIDPLYKADFALLSTVSRESRMLGDRSDLRRLLLQLLGHSELDQSWIDEFANTTHERSTIEELLRHFVDVLQ